MNQRKHDLLLLSALLISLMLCQSAWSQRWQITPSVKTVAAHEISIPHATNILDLKALPAHIGMYWVSETEIDFTRTSSMDEFPGHPYDVVYNLKTGQETSGRITESSRLDKDIEVTKQSVEDVTLRIQSVLLLQKKASVIDHGNTIHYPSADMTLDDLSRCRKNGRTAWVFASKVKPPTTYSAQGTPHRASLLKMEIWTSHSDGTHMRRMGTLCYQKAEGYKPLSHEIHWLPSGQQISFVLNDALYIAGVGK